MTEPQNSRSFNLNWILGILLAMAVAGIILLPKENLKKEHTQIKKEPIAEQDAGKTNEEIAPVEKTH